MVAYALATGAWAVLKRWMYALRGALIGFNQGVPVALAMGLAVALIAVAIYVGVVFGIPFSSAMSDVGLPLVAKCPTELGGFILPLPTTVEGSALLLCGAKLIVFIVFTGAVYFVLLVGQSIVAN